MYKTHHVRTTFGSWDVEKVHAVVARSTFPTQNVQNTPGVRTTFGRLRCRKSRFAVVARQLHFEVTLHCTKLHHVTDYTTLDSTLRLHYATLQCTTVVARSYISLHCIAIHSVTLQLQLHNYTRTTLNWRLHYTTITLQCTPLWRDSYISTTLHNITLHYTTLHYTKLHYTTFTYTSTYTPLHYIPLQLQLQLHNYTELTLHYTRLDYTRLDSARLD